MPDDDRLDRLLVEAGERWRAGLPKAPPVAAVWRAPARRFDLHWGWVLAAAVLIAVLAGSVVVSGGRPGPSPRPAASPVVVAWDEPQIRAAQVRVGDLVTATGIVWAKAGETPLLCAGSFDMLMFGVPPSCSPPDVHLSGSVDLSLLPGRQTVADVTFSSEVRVVGRWTGTAIEQPTITSASLSGYLDPLPCLTPAAGWVNPTTSGGFRALLDPLAREITAHPELYAGYYTQSVSPGNSFPAVEIVRAKVDPRTLVSRIESLFPYAVCLTHDYSQAELDAAIAAFPAPPATIPVVSGDTHRVGVSVVAVDDQTLPIFLAHPAAYPIPLVTKDVPSSAPEPGPTGPLPSPTVTPSQAGVLDLPSTIDGQPVLTGDAARAAITGSTDATPFLVGGYSTATVPRSCPAIRSPDPWNSCLAVLFMLEPWAGPDDWFAVHLTSRSPAWAWPASGEVQAIVVQVHTHDPACPGASCQDAAVLDSVVWYGRPGRLPDPTSTQPPSGLGETDADAAAIQAARGRARGELTVRSAVAGPYRIVGPAGSGDVAGDRWVWAVALNGTFGAPDCILTTGCPAVALSTLVVLDYVSGAVLIQETPAPSNATDAGEAQLRLQKYLDSIGGQYWDLAWGYLSVYSQRRYGSEQAYIDAMTADPSSASSVQIGDPVPLPLSDLVDSGFFEPGLVADVEATVVTSRAFVISTVDPGVDGASAGSRTYVVAALSDTEWRIWIVH